MKIIFKLLANLYLAIVGSILFISKREKKSIFDIEHDPIVLAQTIVIAFLLTTLIIFSNSTKRIQNGNDDKANQVAIVNNNKVKNDGKEKKTGPNNTDE